MLVALSFVSTTISDILEKKLLLKSFNTYKSVYYYFYFYSLYLLYKDIYIDIIVVKNLIYSRNKLHLFLSDICYVYYINIELIHLIK